MQILCKCSNCQFYTVSLRIHSCCKNVAKILWTRSYRNYIRSIFQYRVSYYRSKVAKNLWTRSYRSYIRSIFQYTVPNYRSKVAEIRWTRLYKNYVRSITIIFQARPCQRFPTLEKQCQLNFSQSGSFRGWFYFNQVCRELTKLSEPSLFFFYTCVHFSTFIFIK